MILRLIVKIPELCKNIVKQCCPMTGNLLTRLSSLPRIVITEKREFNKNQEIYTISLFFYLALKIKIKIKGQSAGVEVNRFISE